MFGLLAKTRSRPGGAEFWRPKNAAVAMRDVPREEDQECNGGDEEMKHDILAIALWAVVVIAVLVGLSLADIPAPAKVQASVECAP